MQRTRRAPQSFPGADDTWPFIFFHLFAAVTIGASDSTSQRPGSTGQHWDLQVSLQAGLLGIRGWPGAPFYGVTGWGQGQDAVPCLPRGQQLSAALLQSHSCFSSHKPTPWTGFLKPLGMARAFPNGAFVARKKQHESVFPITPHANWGLLGGKQSCLRRLRQASRCCLGQSGCFPARCR